MYQFDKRLCALANCPIIERKKGGAMAFSPNPVIVAKNDLYLSHEICHILGGRKDFEIFITALQVRDKNELFRHVLNMLYDWYHESIYGKYSGVLYSKLNDLHKTFEYRSIGVPVIDALSRRYLDRDSTKIAITKDVIDLVVMADYIIEDKLPQQIQKLNITRNEVILRLGLLPEISKGIFEFTKKSKRGGPKSDINQIPKKSNYYISAVSRYFHIISELMSLWKKNKYSWVNNYYGEIDWKNLPGMFLGEKLSLPVWRLFQKIVMSRKVYLVIDRSGSTYSIKEPIMDTAIIIAESLRKFNIPISVLDVGVTDSVINDIESPLDISWFTPMNVGGTPLGEVCSLITKADHDSYLLIITDGEPNNWEILISALNSFPGKNLTFVIGDSYGRYVEKIRNAIHVEPHTIIREMLYETALT